MNRQLVFGTRGSELALAQVDLTERALRRVFPDWSMAVKKITTTGDKRLDISLAKHTEAGLKGLFTKEIQALLLSGEIDVAVHSLKDLPGNTPPELTVAAVLERADTADLLISKKHGCGFLELPEGATIATSSVRRRRQLLWMRPDLRIEEIRGNVPTRLRKLRESEKWEAIVLAKAGLDRLGVDTSEFHVERLKSLPAIGQGAVALEIRAADTESASILAKINHEPTFLRVRAERELLRLLDGDCHLPVGVETELSGGSLRMKTILFGEEGRPPRIGEVTGPAREPEQLGRDLFEKIHGS
jgi:hydroxymethylbilane synthase